MTPKPLFPSQPENGSKTPKQGEQPQPAIASDFFADYKPKTSERKAGLMTLSDMLTYAIEQIILDGSVAILDQKWVSGVYIALVATSTPHGMTTIWMIGNPAPNVPLKSTDNIAEAVLILMEVLGV